MITISERPKIFNDIVGQENIIKEFKSLSNDFSKIPEVMLFRGKSGTGKSSVSLIISKLLNCENLVKFDDHYEPCNECSNCEDINEESFSKGTIFIDASSKGKEDLLKLDGILSYESLSKNTIVIIDEAQELSSYAKGVTLKLLEKKRKNTYIILCTMDDSKLDKAIKSRCVTYSFKELKPDSIIEQLFKVMDMLDPHENIIPKSFYEGSNNNPLFLIADNCDGNLREATNILVRCVNSEIFDINKIRKEFNIIDSEYASDFIIDIFNLNKDILKRVVTYEKEFVSELYYKIKKIISDSIVFHNTNYTKFEWQKITAKKLEKYSTIEKIKLYEHLKVVKTYPYFDVQDLIMEISKFYIDMFKTRK